MASMGLLFVICFPLVDTTLMTTQEKLALACRILAMQGRYWISKNKSSIG